MSLTQTVTLLLTAENRTQAAVRAFISSLEGAQQAGRRQGALLADQQRLSDRLAISQRQLGLQQDAAALSATRLELAERALQRTQLSNAATADDEARALLRVDAAQLAVGRSALATQRTQAQIGGINRDIAASADGAATKMGALGAAFGGVATLGVTAFGVAAVVAIDRAIRKASEFQSTLAQVAGGTGNSFKTLQTTGDAALKFARSGQSTYDPTTLVGGTQALYSAGIAPKAINAYLPYASKASTVINAPDLNSVNQAVTDVADTFGKGAKSTATDLQRYTNLLVAAEQASKAPLGDLTRSISRFAPLAQAAGLNPAEAFAFVTKETRSGESARYASTNLSAVISSLLLKPTAKTTELAGALKIDVGPGALAKAGGLPQYIEELIQRGGKNETVFDTLVGQKNSLRGLKEVIGPGGAGIPQYQGLVDRYNEALGPVDKRDATNSAFATTTLGVNQQIAEQSARLNADFILLGDTLEKRFLPAVLAVMKKLLDLVDKAGDGLGAVGGAADKAGTFLDKSGVPGGGKLGAGLGLPLLLAPGLGVALAPILAPIAAVAFGAYKAVGALSSLTGIGGPQSVVFTGNRRTAQDVPVTRPGSLDSMYNNPIVDERASRNLVTGPLGGALASVNRMVSAALDRGFNGPSARAPIEALVQRRIQEYQQTSVARTAGNEGRSAYARSIANLPPALVAESPAELAARTQAALNILNGVKAPKMVDFSGGALAVGNVGSRAPETLQAAQRQDYTVDRQRLDLAIRNGGSDSLLKRLLGTVNTDIGNAGFDPNKAAYLRYSAGSQVQRVIDNRAVDAAKDGVRTADLQYNATKLYGKSVTDQERALKADIAARTTLINLEVRQGKLKGADLTQANQELATFGMGGKNEIAKTGLSNLQDQITYAGLRKQSTAGLIKQEEDYIRKNRVDLGLSPVQAQIEILKLQQSVVQPPGPRLIRQDYRGPGGIAAGYESTVARLSGNGGQDTANRALQVALQQLAEARQQNATLRDLIRSLTRAQQKAPAPVAALSGPALVPVARPPVARADQRTVA